MKKIIIKLPDKKVKKLRLQRNGWKGRRFLKAARLISRLEKSLRPSHPTNLKEKTAVVLKEGVGTKFVNINESIASNNRVYLLYTAACFLEDYLTKDYFNGIERKYA